MKFTKKSIKHTKIYYYKGCGYWCKICHPDLVYCKYKKDKKDLTPNEKESLKKGKYEDL